jgi:LysM repeat protein
MEVREMVGHIGQDKHRQRQVFRQLSDRPVNPADYRFFPWRSSTRDAAPAPPTIGAAYNQTHSLERVVSAMADIAARISALEMKRSAQRQLAEQQQQLASRQQPPTMQPTHQPTQDHAAPCSCQHQPAPQAPPFRDGVKPMDRHPALAPNRNLTFGGFPNPRMSTRDQQHGEKPPSRFTSQEADRMASYLPPGSASRVTTKEAINDFNLRALSQRDATQQHNISGSPQPAVTKGSDLSEAFASELQAIPPGQPNAAQNTLNKYYNKAKTSDQRDGIERTWKDFSSHYDAKGDNPWRPRQAEARDANWSSLYEANKGTIGGDPNKIQIGQSLNLPGGGTHTVEKGETLSGIASTPAGTDLGSKSLAAERGGTEPTGGNYSSGGSLKVSEGGGSVPTPPTKPAEYGGGAQAAESPSSSSSSNSSETPTPPVKPASLGGTGESPSGLNPQATEGGGASPTGSEGTWLAKFVRGLVGEE